MHEADTSALYGRYDVHAWELIEGTNRWRLSPTGWLAGIVLEVDDIEPAISFELTDEDDIALYGSAEKKSYRESYGMDNRIVAIKLPAPIPNMNAAHGYVLRAETEKSAKLKILQLWHPVTD